MISGVDINDWEKLPLTKLYDVPRETYVETEEGDKFLFHHIDGMYSVCYDVLGNLVHLAAWTDVYPLTKGNV